MTVQQKRWQEYTEELHKKDLNDPDNHDGVITHLQPDILECKVNWALGSITMNKASGGDGIPAELFKSLQDDAVKSATLNMPANLENSSGHRTGKGHFSFQSQRRAMPMFKLHNFTHFTCKQGHAQKSFKLGFNSM